MLRTVQEGLFVLKSLLDFLGFLRLSQPRSLLYVEFRDDATANLACASSDTFPFKHGIA
jgi:hypothetical protein